VADALSRALAANRRQLEQRERAAFRRIIDVYATSYRNLQAALDELHQRIEQAVQTGQTLSPAWLHQQHRYIELQAQIGRELQHAAEVTHQVVEGEVAAAIELGQAHAQGLVRTALGAPPAATGTVLFGSWATLNRDAVDAMVGFVNGAGSPVGQLLASLAPHGQKQIGEALTDGIVRGLNPREVGRTLSRMMGGQSARALTIARTETMRAYRESTRSSYANNKRLALKWEWACAADRRTCAACWSMDGQQFPTEQKLDGHPNCRCVMVPVTPTWKDLGEQQGFDMSDVPETRITRTPGRERFAGLPEAEQLAVLGPRKLELYQHGEITLDDMVTRTRSRRWGTMRREATVPEALEHARRRS
jgi:SPP1 gp7 family putative phage head morphogenesis protein